MSHLQKVDIPLEFAIVNNCQNKVSEECFVHTCVSLVSRYIICVDFLFFQSIWRHVWKLSSSHLQLRVEHTG